MNYRTLAENDTSPTRHTSPTRKRGIVHGLPSLARRAGIRAVLAAIVLAPSLWFFGPVLFGGQSFVYRDAAHFYYPSFHWQTQEWAAGRIPLWNPLEECGS